MFDLAWIRLLELCQALTMLKDRHQAGDDALGGAGYL